MNRKVLFFFVAFFVINFFIIPVNYLLANTENWNIERTSFADLFTQLPNGNIDLDEAKTMISRIARIPPKVLAKLISKGEYIRLISGKITDEPEYKNLKGLIPRGWEYTGKTWDDVPGIGSMPAIARIGYSFPGESHSSACLELHESSHRVDSLLCPELSSTQEFKNIWQKESSALFDIDPYDYYKQNPDEFFAEAYTYYNFSPYSYDTLLKKAPNFVDFIEKKNLSHLSKPDLSIYNYNDCIPYFKMSNDAYNKFSIKNNYNYNENVYLDKNKNIYVSFGICNYGKNIQNSFEVKIMVDGKDKYNIPFAFFNEGDILEVSGLNLGLMKSGLHEIEIICDNKQEIDEEKEKNNNIKIVLDLNEDNPEVQNDLKKLDASEWAVAELLKARKYDYVSDDLFNVLGQNITREEFCKITIGLYQKLTGEDVLLDGNNPFKDTNSLEVQKAYKLGIVYGVEKELFSPNDLITREQIAAMLTRTIKYIYPKLLLDTDVKQWFYDEKNIDDWAINSVNFLYNFGIIKGNAYRVIKPKAFTTREQAIILSERILEKIELIEKNTYECIIVPNPVG